MTAARNRHRSATQLALSFGLVLLLFATGRADEPQPTQPVVLGGDAHYAPFQFLDKAGHATGFDVELFREVMKHQGLAGDVRLGDWRDAMDSLDNGDVDTVAMFITQAREQRYQFSRPFLLRYHLVFGRRGTQHITGLQQLVGRRVAVQFDSTAREALMDLSATVQIVPVEAEGSAIVAVHDGTAEFALVPIEIGYKSIIDHDYHDIVAISPPLLERKYAFAVRRGNNALLSRINAGLAGLHSNGALDDLYLKWLANLAPEAVTNARSRRLGWALLGLAIFFAVALGMWLRARRRANVQTSLAVAESRSRQDAEARIEHLAWHDAATDLPNLNALLARMREAEHEDRAFGLVRLDILNLNVTQASAGSRFTDDLLLALARRLQQTCPSDMVAALGRGLYGIMLDPLRNNRDANRRMRTLVDAVHRPLKLGDLTLQQHCRAGLACYPLDASDTEGVLRAAETACSAAHEQAVAMMTYATQLEPDPRNLTLLADLAEAISTGTLGCALQPKHALSGNEFCGAELLVRWTHPRYGDLTPSQFIPLAEGAGAIGELTLYVVRAAVAEWQRWRSRGGSLAIAVNISGNDLADEALIARIISSSRDMGSALTLEITETKMIRDPQRALEAISMLRDAGLRISLDDFGTGYSSFTYLRQLSPDELKIDRSFISQLCQSTDDQAIVLACIALAHELGARVVAEGVEDQPTLQWLAEHGCDVAQGFALAKPMPPDELFRRYATLTTVS